MKFLLDESAEGRILSFLHTQGYDATRIGVDYPKSLPDDQVLAIARNENRILITNDSDFGELIYNQKLSHRGVIFFRFPNNSTAADKIVALSQLLVTHPDQLDKFIVVTPRGVRVRG